MVGRLASTKRRVVLLDALDEHSGIAQGLADSGRYRPVAVGCGPHASLGSFGRFRAEPLADWRWHLGPEQLAPVRERGQEIILLPLSIRAAEWTIAHRRTLAHDWRLAPLPGAEEFALANDKLRVAKLAKRIGLAVPPLVELSHWSAADASRLAYPVLLKPRWGFGGSGIVRFDDCHALCDHLAGVTARQNYYLQRLLKGQDISCGVYCRQGQVLASIVYVPLARDGRYGRFTSIESIDDAEALDVVRNLMRELRWNGLANVDLIRATDGFVHVLEINPRCWGNMAAATPLGVNFAELACQGAWNEPCVEQRCRPGRVLNTVERVAAERQLPASPGDRASGVPRPLRNIAALFHAAWTRRAPALSEN